ncbi:MAG: response regulator [Bacteroidetes bacterium]|nr:response regulator [Bacteroidota bacterium]
MNEAEKLQLLLVDDAPMIRRVLSFALNRNYQITTCADGAEALKLLEHGFKPDVVVTDYEMPELDGLELIRAIRSIPISCPIVMISSLADFEIKKMAIQAGADIYMEKPVAILMLKRHLQSLEKNIGQ